MVEKCRLLGYCSGEWERRISHLGHPYWVWEKHMPRIDDEYLDCVIYLYPSVRDAEQGKRAGGSGFLVGIPSEIHKPGSYIYAVTNSHVIKEGNSPVMRLNTWKGDMDILELDKNNWVHHPDGDDVAVCPIATSTKTYKYMVVHRDNFLTKNFIEKYRIGPGEDVFMVGRFITHEGKQRNMPVVRFGSIAMMPLEPIEQLGRGGFMQESFLVEVRSISGFSGSPVFVYRHLSPVSLSFGPNLLGIDWGYSEIYSGVPIAQGGQFNSGMTAVVPAWKLDELLNIGELVTMRDEIDKRIAEEKKEKGGGFVLGTGPFSHKDFEDALKKVSRPKEGQPDKEKNET